MDARYDDGDIVLLEERGDAASVIATHENHFQFTGDRPVDSCLNLIYSARVNEHGNVRPKAKAQLSQFNGGQTAGPKQVQCLKHCRRVRAASSQAGANGYVFLKADTHAMIAAAFLLEQMCGPDAKIFGFPEASDIG